MPIPTACGSNLRFLSALAVFAYGLTCLFDGWLGWPDVLVGSVSICAEGPKKMKNTDDSLATYYVVFDLHTNCLLYTSPSPRDRQKSRMPSSA